MQTSRSIKPGITKNFSYRTESNCFVFIFFNWSCVEGLRIYKKRMIPMLVSNYTDTNVMGLIAGFVSVHCFHSRSAIVPWSS